MFTIKSLNLNPWINSSQLLNINTQDKLSLISWWPCGHYIGDLSRQRRVQGFKLSTDGVPQMSVLRGQDRDLGHYIYMWNEAVSVLYLYIYTCSRRCQALFHFFISMWSRQARSVLPSQASPRSLLRAYVCFCYAPATCIFILSCGSPCSRTGGELCSGRVSPQANLFSNL